MGLVLIQLRFGRYAPHSRLLKKKKRLQSSWEDASFPQADSPTNNLFTTDSLLKIAVLFQSVLFQAFSEWEMVEREIFKGNFWEVH